MGGQQLYGFRNTKVASTVQYVMEYFSWLLSGWQPTDRDWAFRLTVRYSFGRAVE